MPRCAVFSCLGLGDGLIALVLSNNLQLNGGTVTTFHPALSSLQGWFPELKLRKFPSAEEMEQVLQEFDWFFIIFEKSPWMQSVLEICQKKYPEKMTVLNPIATPNRDYPYWESGRFDGNRTFVENLYTYCKDILKFNVVTKSNGIIAPDSVRARAHEKRVVIHPTSSREGKNWPKEKYIELSQRLSEKGYRPAMILTEEERIGWDLKSIEAPHFTNLSELATFVYESGVMVGNDSGIGHLASCLSVPTVTICRNAQSSKFWRPAWARGEVVIPSHWIPNIKGLRLRDKHWKKWITLDKVLRTTLQLAQSG